MKRMTRTFLICAVLLFMGGLPCLAFELPDGIVTASVLNVHRREDINSEVFWKLNRGEVLKIKEIKGSWCKVALPKGKEGFAHYKYLDIIIWARVLNDYAPVYNSPKPGADVTASLRGIAWIRVTNRSEYWVEIEFNNGQRGWVGGDVLEVPNEFFSQWLTLHNKNSSSTYASQQPSKSQPQNIDVPPAPQIDVPPAPQHVASGSIRSRIVEFARKYMGTPYRYGGTSPDKGFDCSGFVYYVFGNFGYKIERVSRDQATMGVKVNKASLMPGDLVFFDTRRKQKGIVNHAGIYIGNGQFIHSSSGKRGPYVQVSSLTEGFYDDHYLTGRRILD